MRQCGLPTSTKRYTRRTRKSVGPSLVHLHLVVASHLLDPNGRLCALNRAGHLPGKNVAKGECRLDPPFCPNQPPTPDFIASRLPSTDRPLLWDMLTDEIFLDAMVGVARNMNASGVCTTCCEAPFPLWSEAQIDYFAEQLETKDRVHEGAMSSMPLLWTHPCPSMLLVQFLAPNELHWLIWGLFPADKRLRWGAAVQPEQTGGLRALKHKYHPYWLKYE